MLRSLVLSFFLTSPHGIKDSSVDLHQPGLAIRFGGQENESRSYCINSRFVSSEVESKNVPKHFFHVLLKLSCRIARLLQVIGYEEGDRTFLGKLEKINDISQAKRERISVSHSVPGWDLVDSTVE